MTNTDVTHPHSFPYLFRNNKVLTFQICCVKDTSFAWHMPLTEYQLPNSQLRVDHPDLPHERLIFCAAYAID